MLVIQSKKTDYNTKTNKIVKEIADHSHDIYTATVECSKLTLEYFVARLKQTNLISKSDIAYFVSKTDFNNKLENKLKDVTSNKNELNGLCKKLKQYEQKLQKILINKFSILKFLSKIPK